MRKRTLFLIIFFSLILSFNLTLVVDAQDAPQTVVMTYLHTGTPPADMQLVQDTINEIARAEANVEVQYYPMGVFEPFTGRYNTLIPSGERIDLMMVPFQNLADYVNAGLILPLDDLLSQNAPTITELSQQYPITAAGTVDGVVYGVAPLGPTYGSQLGFIMNAAWMDEFNIPVQDIYTLDDVGQILAQVKAAYPEMYPLCLYKDVPFQPFAFDSLGANSASGVLMDLDSTQIVNLYATEQFHNWIQTVHNWYEAGYIPPDVATSTATLSELTNAGVCGAYPGEMGPLQTSVTLASYGFESVTIPTSIHYYASLSPTATANWTVPITAENPEAAIKFLDLMYSDPRILNLLLWGIEGRHYVLTDQEQVIAFPEGVDAQNSGYYVTYGLYGDRRFEYQWDVRATRSYNDAFTAANMANPFRSVGYAFNSANWTNQIIAIQSVTSQYLPALSTGSAPDVEATYAEFLAALDAAGINDVIAANQAQFDAWLAAQ